MLVLRVYWPPIFFIIFSSCPIDSRFGGLAKRYDGGGKLGESPKTGRWGELEREDLGIEPSGVTGNHRRKGGGIG